jgi:hypothetical protein
VFGILPGPAVQTVGTLGGGVQHGGTAWDGLIWEGNLQGMIGVQMDSGSGGSFYIIATYQKRISCGVSGQKHDIAALFAYPLAAALGNQDRHRALGPGLPGYRIHHPGFKLIDSSRQFLCSTKL